MSGGGRILSFEEIELGQDATSTGRVLSFNDTPETFMERWAREREQEAKQRERIINTTKNIGKIAYAGLTALAGEPRGGQIFEEFKQARLNSIEGNKKVGSDIVNMFDNVNVGETLSGLLTGAVDRVSNKKMETLNFIVNELPGEMLNMLVGDTFKAITALDVTGENVQALSPEEHARATKMLIGNAAAALVAPAVSKGIESAFMMRTASKAGVPFSTVANPAGASVQNAQKLATYGTQSAPPIGALGRAIIDDVVAGAVSGVAQGAIAEANTEQALASAAMGVFFAPIGVVTGMIRGMKPVGTIEDAITQARDVREARQLQNLEGLTPKEVAGKLSVMLDSETVEQAISKPIKPTIETPIDALYDDFKSQWDQSKQSFPSAVVEYTEKKKLTPHLNEIFEKFSTKYVDENVNPEIKADLDDLIARQRRREDKKVGDLSDPWTAERLTETSFQKGVFITNEFGVLQVRDIQTGDLLVSATTMEEAGKLLDIMGDAVNPINMSSGASVPVEGIKAPTITPGAGIFSDDYVIKNEPSEKWWLPDHSTTIRWDLGKLANITAMFPFIEAVDTRFGPFKAIGAGVEPYFVSLKQDVLNVFDRGARLAKVAINKAETTGLMKLLDEQIKVHKLTPAELELAQLLIETKSRDEMLMPGGHVKGKVVSPIAVQLADESHALGVNFYKTLLYRRNLKQLHAKMQRLAYDRASANKITNESIGSLTQAEIHDIFNSELSAYQDMPEFQMQLAELQQHFGVEQSFQKIVDGIDQAFSAKDGDGAFHVQAAARLRAGMDNPDKLGLTRQEFIARHKLRPEVVKFAELAEKTYTEYGNIFGIPDWRQIQGFVQHYRTYADPNDVSILGDFAGLDSKTQEFVSKMVRIGETEFYEKNLMLNLRSYVRAGYKGQFLYPAMREADEILKQILPQIEIKDSGFAKGLRERFDDYKRDISGRPSVNDEQAHNALLHDLAQKITKDGKKMTPEEIIKESRKPDHVDTMLSFSTAGLLGGRIALALRDTYDVWQKFFIKFDNKRLGELVTTRATKTDIEFLYENGEILKPDPIDFYNVTHTQAMQGAIARSGKAVADWGFKVSAQGYAFLKNQAIVYNWTLADASKNIMKFRKGQLTQDQLINELSLRRYDPGTQQRFMSYLSSGSTDESAARLLARENTRDMVGAPMRGNQPPVLHSKIGKVFGQLGGWSMTNRSVMQNLLTRGTAQDQINAWAKYALSIGITTATGRALGLNLGRWAILPTSLIATGGPIVNAIEAVSSAGAAELGGNERQTRYTRREAARALSQFVPFGYAVGDLQKAMELQTQGRGFGVGRTAAQAVGIGVNPDARTALDYVIGNTPYKWSDR